MLALVVLLMISDVTARKKMETETTKGEPIGPSAFDKQSGKRILKVSRIAECLVLLSKSNKNSPFFVILSFRR